MRALVVDPSEPSFVRLASLPDPVRTRDEVLVDVHHAALNHGDLNDARSGRVPPGSVLGSDLAGIVRESGVDGPPPGTRVVAMAAGAFATQVAVDRTSLAIVPDGVDLAAAAALPVAGLAAYRALRASGSLDGRRVLITGASGGVGRYAIQLAAHANAHVIASVGAPGRAEGLAELGASTVVAGLAGVDEPVDVVLDNVGGPQLVAAWQLLAPGGVLQSIGWTSGEPAVFPPYSTIGPAKTLSSFLNDGPPGEDLAELVRLLAAGDLTVDIGWRGGLNAYAEAAEALHARRINGKAVFDVS